MALSSTSVLKLYNAVIDDVITNVRDAFLDEGVDEQVLQEMKQIWTNKLMASKAVEVEKDSLAPQPPPILANNPKPNVTKAGKKTNSTAASSSSNNLDVKPIANNNINKAINGSTKIPITMPPLAAATPIGKKVTQQSAVVKQESSTTNSGASQVLQNVSLDPNKLIPIQITLPPQPGVSNSEQRMITIQVPASAIQEHQLQRVLTGNIITSIMPLPLDLASTVLQHHVNSMLNPKNNISLNKQLDGTAADTSDEEGSDISDDILDGDEDEEDDKDEDFENEPGMGAEEEPLNSEDDVTDEDASDLFETDNVVVCQYDKITRSRNKWKFYLKDGIMNLGGKDYVFQKSNGDAEW